MYNSTVDVWSMGVLLYEIIYKKNPIPDEFRYDHMVKMKAGTESIELPPTPDIDPKFITLLKRMLENDMQKRIKWPEIFSYLETNFEFLIYKLEQILRHQISLAKMQCLAIEFLRNSR